MPTNRRTFIAAAVAAPFFLKGQDKAGAKLPVLGEGDHRYEAIHDWGEVPAHIVLGNTHGVCEDAQGNIYVHHTVHATSKSADSIVVFDAKGKFVRSWGSQFKDGAHGLHIRKEGSTEYLYICDQLHGLVTKRTLKGEEVWTLGYPSDSEKYKLGLLGGNIPYRPTNVALAANGDVYVGDGYGSFFVNQYDKNAKFIRSFGGNGKEAGQLSQPHGLMVDSRGGSETLLVADRGNRRIQRFSLDGKHLEFIEGTQWPCHFHERQGDVVVPDLQARVTLLGKDNKVITHLGDGNLQPRDFMQARVKPRAEFTPGKFICPHGAIFDHTGNIFVVEWVEVGRITKLRKVA
jgi:hypothetical protein